MGLTRRALLQGTVATGLLSTAFVAGMLRPTQVLAEASAGGPALDAKDLATALKSLGADAAAENSQLAIKAPEIAENGAVVPIEINSSIPNTVSLAVLATKNPMPLCAVFEFEPEAVPSLSLRLKVAETSAIKAVAKTKDGKVFAVDKEVKVTVGGCGG